MHWYYYPDMDDLTLGWVAGIIEGEGCFSLNRHQRRAYGIITVTSTDHFVVQQLQERTGVGTLTGPYSRGHKPFWRWTVNRTDDVRALAELMYPHMSPRRQERIVELLNNVPGPPCGHEAQVDGRGVLFCPPCRDTQLAAARQRRKDKIL